MPVRLYLSYIWGHLDLLLGRALKRGTLKIKLGMLSLKVIASHWTTQLPTESPLPRLEMPLEGSKIPAQNPHLHSAPACQPASSCSPYTTYLDTPAALRQSSRDHPSRPRFILFQPHQLPRLNPRNQPQRWLPKRRRSVSSPLSLSPSFPYPSWLYPLFPNTCLPLLEARSMDSRASSSSCLSVS